MQGPNLLNSTYCGFFQQDNYYEEIRSERQRQLELEASQAVAQAHQAVAQAHQAAAEAATQRVQELEAEKKATDEETARLLAQKEKSVEQQLIVSAQALATAALEIQLSKARADQAKAKQAQYDALVARNLELEMLKRQENLTPSTQTPAPSGSQSPTPGPASGLQRSAPGVTMDSADATFDPNRALTFTTADGEEFMIRPEAEYPQGMVSKPPNPPPTF